jgi:uncharacterized protein (DUF2235 family)
MITLSIADCSGVEAISNKGGYSDGAGNTFDKSVSNVTRLIKLLALNDSKKQIVVYDQGIGTNARHRDAVKDYHQSIPDKDSLTKAYC